MLRDVKFPFIHTFKGAYLPLFYCPVLIVYLFSRVIDFFYGVEYIINNIDCSPICIISKHSTDILERCKFEAYRAK